MIRAVSYLRAAGVLQADKSQGRRTARKRRLDDQYGVSYRNANHNQKKDCRPQSTVFLSCCIRPAADPSDVATATKRAQVALRGSAGRPRLRVTAGGLASALHWTGCG